MNCVRTKSNWTVVHKLVTLPLCLFRNGNLIIRINGTVVADSEKKTKKVKNSWRCSFVATLTTADWGFIARRGERKGSSGRTSRDEKNERRMDPIKYSKRSESLRMNLSNLKWYIVRLSFQTVIPRKRNLKKKITGQRTAEDSSILTLSGRGFWPRDDGEIKVERTHTWAGRLLAKSFGKSREEGQGTGLNLGISWPCKAILIRKIRIRKYL